MALTERGYVPHYTTDTVAQDVTSYTAADQATWRTLLHRQRALLVDRACAAHRSGLEHLGIDRAPTIPDFAALSDRLAARTGWTLVGVRGLLPDDVFFDHLAHRRFPATTWIRPVDRLDYLPEPDLFHDLFGHVPLLCDRSYADAVAAYGRAATEVYSARPNALPYLARLYWHTVEFGLLRTDQGPRIYGAGVLSSAGESVHCLDSAVPQRRPFDVRTALRTPYRIDAYQPTYFVIDSFDALVDALAHGPALAGPDVGADLDPLRAEAAPSNA